MTILESSRKMTERDLALVFGIHEETIKKLAETNQIPKNGMYFNFYEVLKHFEHLNGGVT